MSKVMRKRESFGYIPLVAAFFANVSLNFSDSNYMCMAFAHLAIILSSMQRYKEYLVVLKGLGYSFSSGYKRQYASKSKDVT